MANARFNKAKLTGINTVTGPIRHHINDEAELFINDPTQLDRLKKTLGLEYRFLAPPGITTLDLCKQAAVNLLINCHFTVNQIDAIIFVTQTPDYWQPGNACLIHGQMSFPKSTAAFDVNQGCSGWIYGLYLAFSMIESGGCGNILLLAGDTVTQTINPKDRAVWPLFGDAGSATLIERSEEDLPSWFCLHTDGIGWENINIPAGGHRKPKSSITSVEKTDEDGNKRSEDNLYVNNIEVFGAMLREEPKAVKELLEFSKKTVEQVDLFVFHQANKFILHNLAIRIKAPILKVPMETISKFGNQSSASIPATLCDAIPDKLRQATKSVACSGFGVGLSWASCLINIGPLLDCSITQYQMEN